MGFAQAKCDQELISDETLSNKMGLSRRQAGQVLVNTDRSISVFANLDNKLASDPSCLEFLESLGYIV